ncbi:MAG: hypothetical protein ACK4TL_03450 [Hyphomicrobiaceae bacterium]
MRLIAVATGAIALLTLAGGPPARAADLGYGDPSDRYRSAYEDDRYRDLYGPPPGKYSRRYVEKEEIEENYAVDDDDYEEKRLVPRRAYRYSDRYAFDCTPRHVIRDRLFRQGWQDFEEIDVRRDVTIVVARRPNGLPYRLKIDRCTGDVVSARPLAPVPGGPYAYGPRRYYGPYFR